MTADAACAAPGCVAAAARARRARYGACDAAQRAAKPLGATASATAAPSCGQRRSSPQRAWSGGTCGARPSRAQCGVRSSRAVHRPTGRRESRLGCRPACVALPAPFAACAVRPAAPRFPRAPARRRCTEPASRALPAVPEASHGGRRRRRAAARRCGGGDERGREGADGAAVRHRGLLRRCQRPSGHSARRRQRKGAALGAAPICGPDRSAHRRCAPSCALAPLRRSKRRSAAFSAGWALIPCFAFAQEG